MERQQVLRERQLILREQQQMRELSKVQLECWKQLKREKRKKVKSRCKRRSLESIRRFFKALHQLTFLLRNCLPGRWRWCKHVVIKDSVV